MSINNKDNVYQRALQCLLEDDILKKCEQTHQLYQKLKSGELNSTPSSIKVIKIEIPGRPQKPDLIDGKKVPRRGFGRVEGRAALFHALAHIEFNAINLALDAIYRFQDMPKEYVLDWAKVASEEAYHFQLIADRLKDFNMNYGDLPAHNGLWDMAVRTDFDVMVRMALVPRVLEARGLDVAPKMIEKLKQLNDMPSANILSIIYKDEIGHVKIGNHWYLYCCEQRQIDSKSTFVDLIKRYTHGFLRGPFNYEARAEAGFTPFELQALELYDEQTR